MDGATIFGLIVVPAGLAAGLIVRQVAIRKAAPMPEDQVRELCGRLLEEVAALPPGKDGYVALTNTPYAGQLHIGHWVLVKRYLRTHRLAAVRGASIRPTAAGRRLVAERTAIQQDPTYKITNYGSMVTARDISGGIINTGTIHGDVVQGITAEQLLALADAMRSDLARVADPELRAQASRVAERIEGAAASPEPPRRSLLEQASLIVSLGQGAFALTQSVLGAIFGS